MATPFESRFVVAFAKVFWFTLEICARRRRGCACARSHFYDLLQAAARLPSLKFHAQVVLMGRQVACARGYSPVLHLHSKHARRPTCSEAARARQPRFERPPPSRAGAFVGRPRDGYGHSRRFFDALGADDASSSQAHSSSW